MRRIMTVVVVLSATFWLLGAPAAATGDPTPEARAEVVPVLCNRTGDRLPSVAGSETSLTGPTRISTGEILDLHSVVAAPFPPGAPATTTSAVVVTQNGTSTTTTVSGWGPTDLAVPVSAPSGTMVTVRLGAYSSVTPVPEFGIDFVQTCRPLGPGTVARWVVDGFSCARSTGTARYGRGLTGTERSVRWLRLQLDATGCDVPGAASLQLRVAVPTPGPVNCRPGLDARGLATGRPGTGRILWPDGSRSRLAVSVSGTGDAFGVEVEGRITSGPQRGQALGATVHLTPTAPCGDTPGGPLTAATGRIDL